MTDNQPITSNIFGTVDGFDPPRRIRGWFVDRSLETGTPDVVIAVNRRGKSIGLGKLSFERPDLVARPGCLVGFAIDCSEDVLDDEIANQTIEIVATIGSTNLTLAVWEVVRAQAQARAIAVSVPRLRTSAVADLIKALASHTAVSEQINGELLRIAETIKRSAKDTTRSTAELQIKVAESLVSLLVAPGVHSGDGSVVVGGQGFLFLTEGSNAVLSRYSDEGTSGGHGPKAEAWRALIDRRQQAFASIQTKYIQLIIPEKISAIPEEFPFLIETPTQALSLIEGYYRTSDTKHYLSALDVLTRDKPTSQLRYCKTDTHPSPVGNFFLMTEIIQRLGLDCELTATWNGIERFCGDISRRMFGVPLYEELRLPKIAWRGVLLGDPSLVSAFDPESSGHTNSRRIWSTPTAPLQKTVVIFGNSCFERGAHPGGLSWWFARVFKDVHFFWTGEMDLAYVESVNPDFVICQTVERFLFSRLPEV